MYFVYRLCVILPLAGTNDLKRYRTFVSKDMSNLLMFVLAHCHIIIMRSLVTIKRGGVNFMKLITKAVYTCIAGIFVFVSVPAYSEYSEIASVSKDWVFFVSCG